MLFEDTCGLILHYLQHNVHIVCIMCSCTLIVNSTWESMNNPDITFLPPTAIVVHTDPPSGTQIVVEEHSHVIILCDIEGVQQQHWVLATPHELTIISDDDDRFLITGNHMSQLIVRNVTEELDGALIFCQIAFHGNIRIANFSIHIERKPWSISANVIPFLCISVLHLYTCWHILLYIHNM